MRSKLHGIIALVLAACTSGSSAGPVRVGDGVACGTASCDVACCLQDAGGSCVGDSAACANGLVRCDGPEDCGSGQRCCEAFGFPGAPPSQVTYCSASQVLDPCATIFDAVVCHRDADCPQGKCVSADAGASFLKTCEPQ